MPPKRATVPINTFGSSSTALDKLTGRVPAVEEHTEPAPPVEPQHDADPADPAEPAVAQSSNTVLRQNNSTVLRQNSNTVTTQASADSDSADDSSTREKVTFYLRPDQVEKLDELVIAYKRRTGQRMNRNELMRQMLDRITIDFFTD